MECTELEVLEVCEIIIDGLKNSADMGKLNKEIIKKFNWVTVQQAMQHLQIELNK